MSSKKENMTIMMLICSAVVMLVVLTIVNLAGPQDAFAGAMQAQGGDYRATIASLSDGQDTLWILDCRSKVMGIYLYDTKDDRLELKQTTTIQQLHTTR